MPDATTPASPAAAAPAGAAPAPDGVAPPDPLPADAPAAPAPADVPPAPPAPVALTRAADVLKEELLDRAVAQASSSRLRDPAGPAGLGALLRRYYRHVIAEDLLELGPVDLLGAAASHRRTAEHRPPGRAAVRVFTPTVEEHGWACGHTVVEVVTDDMPFLVDSVTGELARAGNGIHRIVHPQLVVRRDLMGTLAELVELDASDRAGRPADALVESWIHVEVDRVTDPKTLDALAEGLHDVLRDVREAVEDWPRMRRTASALADEVAAAPPPGLPDGEAGETVALLRWLADDNFTFLGYREYDLVGGPGEEALVARVGSGLGILRADQQHSRAFAKLPPAVRALSREPRLLVLTKANSRSTVHRNVYLDYVGVKRFDADGRVVGERRFLGLFSAAAYTQSVTRIPVLRRTTAAVLDASGFAADSHSGKDLLQFLETYPRDELFQMDAAELLEVSLAVLHLQERRQTRLFLRRDAYGRYMSCLVYLPRDRYTTAVRLRMAALLGEAFAASSVDFTARVTESVLARLHFVAHVASGDVLPVVDRDELERRLVEATRAWEDDFVDALVDQTGEEQAARLQRAYAAAFPEAYKEDFPARTAVADVRVLDQLGESGTALNLYEPYGTDERVRRLKVYRSGEPISLTSVLPVLQRMGVEVVDERPYELARPGGPRAYLYDFGLRFGAAAWDPPTLKARFQEAFLAAWRGATEVDGFNALVVTAGLDWRQVGVLRAYARYLRQVGVGFSQEYLESVLVAHTDVTRLLVEIFEAAFDPAAPGDPATPAGVAARRAARDALAAQVRGRLDAVASLDHDRILRAFLTLLLATVRTNHYRPTPDGSPRADVAVKLEPERIADLPRPRPRHEIWVYSPRVEGVHLRFGAVARGGLRWSDRREDFRTEVLGLVKAQAVKNAVIVPVGAKGGFYPKRLPDPAAGRDAWIAEGVAAYRLFVGAMLDLTDNLVGGAVVPPEGVVRLDGDDPYLVVAADKGTATFSDTANAISAEHGYWLGDAFASGGSAGYDHKAMGITARGAWESVKKHFRELGVDTQAEDFTCVGVGDMSGDVFGNGMLLSPHVRLVAAFDHRHVFVDPAPDPAASFAERRRLFDLPRSSWADYDPALLSAGGGVYPRTAKSVPVSPQVRAVLGLDGAVAELTPAELVRAVLLAPVDLLWNGGIGTYVKASSETAADVGDKANDAVRVDGDQLRCKVVGEGGNLGFTQLGRVQAALCGVRINTDAIDNSAGVDTSDHEVNIKVLLDAAVRDGDLTGKQRNQILAGMTDEVAALVLADNYAQNVLLANARAQAGPMTEVHLRFMAELEAAGELDRALEFLPSDAALRRRAAAGNPLTGPELSVLAAYAKMSLTQPLLASTLADDPWFARALRGYFPAAVAGRFGDRLADHPLSREIVTTVVVNEMVNTGGITYAFRAAEETGAAPADIARAYAVARDVFDLPALWRRIEALDNTVPSAAQHALYLEVRRLLDRATRWLLQARGGTVDVGVEVERFGPAVARIAPLVPGMLLGAEGERLAGRAAVYTGLGAPEDISLEVACCLDVYSLLDAVEVARRTGADPEEVLRLYFVLSERYEVDRLLGRISNLPRDGRWEALARQALRSDLYGVLAGLTERVLRATAGDGPADPAARIAVWEERHAQGLARARATLADIAAGDAVDLAPLSVALRTMRTLVAQAEVG